MAPLLLCSVWTEEPVINAAMQVTNPRTAAKHCFVSKITRILPALNKQGYSHTLLKSLAQMILAALQEPPLSILIEHYANPPDSTHCDDPSDNGECLRDGEDRQSTPERNLRCSECCFRVFRFTLALVHTTFHLFDFTFPLPHGSVIAGLWIVSLCDLEAPGWGSLGFRIVLCCFSSSQIAVWLFRDFGLPG